MTEQTVIHENSTVLVHVDITLEDGSVADSTRVNGQPSIIGLGQGHVSEAFEKALIGLTSGDKTEFTLGPDDAFGEPLPENIIQIEADKFEENLKLKSGVIVEFTQPDGKTVPGIIRQIEGDIVTVDFNHPLCGQTLKFQLEIMAVDKEIENIDN